MLWCQFRRWREENAGQTYVSRALPVCGVRNVSAKRQYLLKWRCGILHTKLVTAVVELRGVSQAQLRGIARGNAWSLSFCRRVEA